MLCLSLIYSALEEVQNTLKRYIDIKDKASEMYKKNLSLAVLETIFRLPATAVDPSQDDAGLSPRVVQIGLFLDQYFERLSAFDDVKSYVAELSFEEGKALMERVLPKILDEVGFRLATHQPGQSLTVLPGCWKGSPNCHQGPRVQAPLPAFHMPTNTLASAVRCRGRTSRQTLSVPTLQQAGLAAMRVLPPAAAD